VTGFPSDPAGERAADDQPVAELEFTGFDAQLAAALKDLGKQVGPDEFDSRAILRRTARRKTSQVLGTAVAGLAVVAGATVFATHVGPIAAGNAAATSTASRPVTPGSTDPLTPPGYFRTAPGGSTPVGYSAYGATSSLTQYPGSVGGGFVNMVFQDARAGSGAGGTEYSVSVGWTGGYAANVTDIPHEGTHTLVGTVNGHPAYYSADRHSLAFWTGSAQGYGLVSGWVVGQSLTLITDPTVLLYAARAFDTAPVAVPLPLRITGLNSAKAISASFSQAAPGAVSASLVQGSASASSWYVEIGLQIEGRTYEISANPGRAVTPPTPSLVKMTGGSLVSATKTVDGLGIMVSTASTGSGSPSAPTVAQVLAHITSLGTDPSGWTTNVIAE
jgi:hypothetical protein